MNAEDVSMANKSLMKVKEINEIINTINATRGIIESSYIDEIIKFYIDNIVKNV